MRNRSSCHRGRKTVYIGIYKKFNKTNFCEQSRESGNIEYNRKNKIGVEKYRIYQKYNRVLSTYFWAWYRKRPAYTVLPDL